MNQSNEQIKRIESKIQQLLKGYHQLQKENEKLIKENHKLKTSIEQVSAENEQLLQKIDVLKLNVGAWSETSKKDLEKSINNYLKDIEKCLSLLHL